MSQETTNPIQNAHAQKKPEEPPDMKDVSEQEKASKQGQGPKYFVPIEGTSYPWDSPTITTEQIIELGGWELSQGVIEVDQDQNERTLSPGEVIELKPGQGFGKKFSWKRG